MEMADMACPQSGEVFRGGKSRGFVRSAPRGVQNRRAVTQLREGKMPSSAMMKLTHR